MPAPDRRRPHPVFPITAVLNGPGFFRISALSVVVCALDGRYNWHDGVDPTRAEFLARASTLRYLADGETAINSLGIYDTDAEQIGDVGVSVSDLPDGTDAVYRVEVTDGRIVALDSGAAVVDA